jgi:Tfp pilus assembly protein PilP
LALYGIVAGKQAMAVIREGDQRYYVKVGDRIGDRYRVQAISQKEVVLVGSEGKVILRMGGRQ